MSNPLYNLLGGANLPANMQNMQGLIQQFKQFQSNFKGNPQQQVQQLLNSGKVSQAQYNQAVQMANALKNMLG